ncbi:MAG: GFA family protein [Rhodospirillales bacterium]|nr:GFA family protein [Rhodospirillales bacterium]
MAKAKHTGRCSCGAVRYQAVGEPLWTANCHCETCRRITGSPMTVFAGFEREDFAYLAGKPKTYRSSPGVKRSFCGKCGTPLTYESKRWAGEVHILVCSLDRPGKLKPEMHEFFDEKVSWFNTADKLPRYRSVVPSEDDSAS